MSRALAALAGMNKHFFSQLSQVRIIRFRDTEKGRPNFVTGNSWTGPELISKFHGRKRISPTGGVMWHPCRRFAGDLQVKREEIVGSSMPVDNHVYGNILTKKYFIVSTVLYSTRSSILRYSGYLAFCEYKMDQKWISVLGLFQLGLIILRGNNSGFLNNSS